MTLLLGLTLQCSILRYNTAVTMNTYFIMYTKHLLLKYIVLNSLLRQSLLLLVSILHHLVLSMVLSAQLFTKFYVCFILYCYQPAVANTVIANDYV